MRPACSSDRWGAAYAAPHRGATVAALAASHRGAVVAALAVASLVALGSPAGAGVTDGLPADVVEARPPVSEQTYPGVDHGRRDSPRDDRHAKTTWRVVEQTGNCCENYLTVTPDGRLLDFGGSYIHFSDDRGVTWHKVTPKTPLVNGEGAIVAAPGGDVLGVEWDPYSGDHLQSYKYEADTGEWRYMELPLHQPFYDREWISVVPGPVTLDGRTYEYVSLMKGGWPSKEVWYLSTDGLNYTQVTSKMAEQMLHGRSVTGPLPTAADPVNDWVQPNTNGAMTALGGGDLLAAPDGGAAWGLFDGTSGSWSAYRLPDGSEPSGRYQVDSAGRVHNVVQTSGNRAFDYRISDDGGATWRTTSVSLPDDHVIEEIDFRANLAVGVAGVAMRAQGPQYDQDLAYKLDITGDQPRLIRSYEVGLGDTGATGGVGNAVRFDFETVAIFPDGRLAVSFLDSTTNYPSATNPDRNSPAIAVEGDTVPGGSVVGSQV